MNSISEKNEEVSPSSPSSPFSHLNQIAALSVARSKDPHIDDVDGATMHNDQQDVLTSPCSSRLSRPVLSPTSALHQLDNFPRSAFVIQSHQQNNFVNHVGQDVRPPLSDCSPPSLIATSSHYQHVLRSNSGSLSSSSAYPIQNAPLNSSNPRLQTSFPVFQTTQDLAAHHGIPRKLPQPPRVNSNHTISRPPVPRFNQQPSSSEISSPSFANDAAEFRSLLSNYLDMVSKKPDDTHTVPQSPSVPHRAMEPAIDDTVAAQNIADLFFATPEWAEYLTSPFDDESPLDNPLETPAQGSADLGDFFTSPVVADLPATDSLADLPLFASTVFPESNLDIDNNNNKMSVSTAPQSSSQWVSASHTPNLDGLLTMSPTTPALDQSLSPKVTDLHDFSHSLPKSKIPTGTRKNVTPETLVPLDAPTQPRNYLTPSATSRKELPAVFARKRARSMAFDTEEDELGEELPTTVEAEAIAAKRRQNTLAARRSRKRKLEYQRMLEESVEQEKKEKEIWKGRALMCQAQLQAMGVTVPFVDEM